MIFAVINFSEISALISLLGFLIAVATIFCRWVFPSPTPGVYVTDRDRVNVKLVFYTTESIPHPVI